MSTDPRTILRERFGFDDFRPGQERAIETLLAGRSAAAVFPTGSGKSLCYQLPALCFAGVTLVVSPLIALMKNQIDQLHARGIDARRLDSSLTLEETRETMEAVRSERLKLLYVAPERFNNERFRQAMLGVRIALFAVDEAHCISEWGHNFRPDYLKLARFAARCKAERRLALTATASPRVLEDVCRELGIAAEDAVRTGFYRPNLTVQVTPVTAQERPGALLRKLQERPRGATIVYVTLQRTAVDVAKRLADAGLPARPYHAGLKSEQRAETQDWFLGGTDHIVVATIAFGMGIDKPDIRYVYHFNLPKSLESLSQEIGRAGRDGQPATCELLACADDLAPLENFAHGDAPDRFSVAALCDEIFAGETVLDLSFYELAREADMRILVVRTLLTYLELDGWLEAGTPRYASYRFKAQKSSAEILGSFEGERRAFLRAIFQCARKGRIWLSLDADEAARATGQPRERIVTALDWLAEQGWLELKAEKVRHRYRVLRRPADEAEREALIEELCRRARLREQGELDRLAGVVRLLEADACQVSMLGEHFGEPLPEPCGHCGHCLSGPVRLAPRRVPSQDEQTWREVLALLADDPQLRRPRSVARFLCGIRSPAVARARLARHKLFGAFRSVPFGDLLAGAQERLG